MASRLLNLLASNNKMKNYIQSLLCTQNCWLKGNLIASIILMILGFFMPPVGVIDNSILLGVGEMFMFSALGETVRTIQAGHSAKLKIKEMELEIKNIKNGED